MFTFLPIFYQQLAPTPVFSPIDETAPAAAPSWPAPPRQQEEVLEGKFCVVRVARGFARKGFRATAKATAPQPSLVERERTMIFDPAAPAWSAPQRPVAVELKLPRRASARPETKPARPPEVESLQC